MLCRRACENGFFFGGECKERIEQQNYLFIRLSAFFIESNLETDKWLIN
jgi:hypothetical protein